MTVTTPKLGLPKVQGPDNSRDYLKGAISGGGLWRALEILDNAILSTGSITLDNATLTNPTITGWTNAQHNHSSAATAGSTLGPATTLATPTLQTPAVSGVMTFGGDATLQRTSAGTLKLGGDNVALILDPVTDAGSASLQFFDRGTARYTLQASGTENGGLYLYFHGITGNTGFRERAKWEPTGTLTLTPDVGQKALVVPNSQAISSASGEMMVTAPTGGVVRLAIDGGASFVFYPGAAAAYPEPDNTLAFGKSDRRWTSVWAVSGVVNTSLAEAKQAITPLDPAAALAAVLHTDPVVFDYKPPERTAEWYELPDDPEQAERVLHDRLTSSPLEEAARHQAGFVLQDATGQYQTDPLFETGEGQSNAANSVGVILAAIHALSSRLDALEGA